MFQHPMHQEQRVVAVAASEATAELVATTLAVHGIQAATGMVDRLYPSVSWAQGIQVVVAVEHEAAARELLRDLTGDDVVEVDADPDDG